MDWTQALTIIATLGTFIFWLSKRIDHAHDRIDDEMRESSKRFDQLYNMFCEMQREIKDLYKERKD